MNPPKDIFTHHYWIQNCDRLKYSAEILIEELMRIKDRSDKKPWEYSQQIRALLEGNLLLLGYSIENLLKGYAIFQYSQNREISPDVDIPFIKKNIWKIKSGHDLIEIANNYNLALTEDETHLLKKLEKYISWKGRYHIPLFKDGIKEATKGGIGDSHTSRDQEIANTLIQKLKNTMAK